jgi:hypothetical protein
MSAIQIAGLTLKPLDSLVVAAPEEQLRQPRDIDRDASLLVSGEPAHRMPLAGLVLEIDIRESLTRCVRDGEALGVLDNRPGRRKPSRGRGGH